MGVLVDEVIATVTPCQFSPRYTYFACGYFVAEELAAAAPAGVAPVRSSLDVFNRAMQDYAIDHGGNGPDKTDGQTGEQARALFRRLGLHWNELGSGDAAKAKIKDALKQGMPCSVCVAEVSVYDRALGGNPYTPWSPAGLHAIVATGLVDEHTLIVRDTANVDGNWQLRPQPRYYDLDRLSIADACSFDYPWLHLLDERLPQVQRYFAVGKDGWKCRASGVLLSGAFLQKYRSVGNRMLFGLSVLGLPVFMVSSPQETIVFERGGLAVVAGGVNFLPVEQISRLLVARGM